MTCWDCGSDVADCMCHAPRWKETRAVGNYDSWKNREPEPERNPRPRTEPVSVCRCGSRMEHGSAIGHLSMQSICLSCSRQEGAEYLRRRANAVLPKASGE